MKCHIIGCNKEATKVITKKNGLHDTDLPVCDECVEEYTNPNEIAYDMEKCKYAIRKADGQIVCEADDYNLCDKNCDIYKTE